MVRPVRELGSTQSWLSWAAALVFIVGCGEADGGESPRPNLDAVADAAAPDAEVADAGEADLGPGTPVTGSWVNTQVSRHGKTPGPVDLSHYEVGVWTQGPAPRYFAGSGSMDGAFMVPNVPPGPFLLVLNQEGFFTDCVASDGSVRDFDLGNEFFREGTPLGPIVAAKTVIALTLSNLAPWGAGDSIRLITNLGATRTFTGNYFQLNATTGTLSVSYDNQPGFDGPGRGDEVLILQQGNTVLPTGVTVWTARTAATTKALHTVDGQTVMATENLQALPADGVVAFDVRRSQYLPFAPGGPTATDEPSIKIEVARSLPGVNAVGSFVTSTIDVPNGATDVQTEARESNPFPATWIRFARATVSYPIAMFVPGGMRPLVSGATMRVSDRADVLLAAPIVPRLGPPRAPQIAGRPADVPQTGVGLTPTLSWSAPSLGKPTLYQVSVSRIDVEVDQISTQAQISIATDQTSVTLPPAVLRPGIWYRFLVTAIAADDVHVTTPKRVSVPRVDASLYSGRFTP
jgi:hypothetical protein